MNTRNKLGYLSIFGLLGLLGFVTGHYLLFFFFGYFGYAYYFTVIEDEMFKEHLLKASAISFFILLFVMMTTILLVTFTRNIELAQWGLFLGFVIGNLSFVVLHSMYEIKESYGAKDETI